MDLQKLRMEIDEIDAELVALIGRRMALSRSVADYKARNGLPVLDAAREQLVLERAEDRVDDPALKPSVRRIMESLMAESRLLQHELLAEEPAIAPEAGEAVAYLGPEGSFSHEAALRYFGEASPLLAAASFEEIAEDVESGRARYGLLPVENTLTGGIFPASDLLRGAQAFEYRVAVKDHVETMRYARGALETVRVPAGSYEAQLMRREGEPGSDRKRVSRSWFAASLGWLPVQIEQTEKNGDTVTLKLVVLRGNGNRE